MKKAESALFWFAALLGALPFLLTTLPPSMDLPEHVAVMSAIRHTTTPGWRVQDFYQYDLVRSSGYVAYHVAGALLSVLVGGVERASAVLLCAQAIAVPLSVRALLRSLGKDERYALFSALFVLSRPFAEGLVSYCASVPIVIFALAWHIRLLGSEGAARKLAIPATLAVFAFYLHPLSLVLLLLLSFVASFNAKRLGASAFAVRWIFPALLLACVATLLKSRATPIAGPVTERVLVFIPRTRLATELFAWWHDFWRSGWDTRFALAGWLALIVSAVAAARSFTSEKRSWLSLRLAGAALLLYFALPTQLGSPTIGILTQIDQRTSIFVGLLLLVALVPPRSATNAVAGVARGVLVAATLSGLALNVQEMKRYQREEVSSLDRILGGLEPGLKMVSLAFDGSSRVTVVPPFLLAGSVYRARYGGLSEPSFSRVPHWPLHYRAGAAPPNKPELQWEYNPCAYRHTVDGQFYDYVLTRGERDPFQGAPTGRRFRVRKKVREWTLYEADEFSPTPSIEDDEGPCKPSN